MAEEHKRVTQFDDSGQTTVLAKLTKTRGFARGDFTVIQGSAAGIVITNISMGDANDNDKGKVHKEGEFFYISGFPTRDSIVDDEEKLNRPSVKGKMTAELVLTEKDSIEETSSATSASLGTILKDGAKNMLNSLKTVSSTCMLAPINLKDAVKRHKKATGGSKGSKYKKLAPNAEVNTDKKGKKTYQGSYIEHDEKGKITISANNKGLSVDEDGNVESTGKMELMESPSEPHGLIGMPTKKNGLRDINPGTFAFPAGLGPLALGRLPDFSMVNWALKTMAVVQVVQEIAGLIDEKKKSGKRIGQVVEDRQKQYEKERNNSVKGKIQ